MTLDVATTQPRAGRALEAALEAGPLHAYLFTGPRGTGKRTAARAFAAELLAQGAEDPEGARRRALAEPSPHPDLVWLSPPGAQHLVEEVRELVIRGAAMRPFEGQRRVFVVDAADAMADESQNALLKTLEEPGQFAHLLLLSSEPELVAETVRSRCQEVVFEPLSPEAVEAELTGEGAAGLEARAAARLCGGDGALARRLLSGEGKAMRAEVERAASAALANDTSGKPWKDILDQAESVGSAAGGAIEAALTERAEAYGKGREANRLKREAAEAAKRVSRRERTAALDLSLSLLGSWFRDLGALAAGADDLVLNADRADQLAAAAEGIRPEQAREACEAILETRRALRLNVSEELALEALFFRVQELLA